MKFKIGDVVEIINKNHPQYGDEYEILDTANSGAFFQLDNNLWVHVDALNLVKKEIIKENLDGPVTNYDKFEEILDQIKLSQSVLDFNWRFKYEDSYDFNSNVQGWFVWVEFERPDINTGEIGKGTSRKEFVPKGTWTSGVVKTCWLLLELTIRHELMEAFTFQGARIFHPHNSVFDLAKINAPGGRS